MNSRYTRDRRPEIHLAQAVSSDLLFNAQHIVTEWTRNEEKMPGVFLNMVS